MASLYEIVCKKCGARWDWYKYDEPDEQCPECGEKLIRGIKDYKGDDSEVWDSSKVIVFGVGSTSLDIEEVVNKIKGEKK